MNIITPTITTQLADGEELAPFPNPLRRYSAGIRVEYGIGTLPRILMLNHLWVLQGKFPRWHGRIFA